MIAEGKRIKMDKAEKLVRRAKKEAEKESGVHETGGLNFGLLLVIIGVVWLAINQGWIPANWSLLWPIIVIALGLWLMLAKKRH